MSQYINILREIYHITLELQHVCYVTITSVISSAQNFMKGYNLIYMTGSR